MLARVIDGKKAEKLLVTRFGSAGTADAADWQKAYMKSALDFHGVSSAEVRGAARELLADHPDLGHDGIVRVVDHLMASSWFDIRSTGVAILERVPKKLLATDLPWLVELVRRGACWAHVDGLATNVIGPVLAANPKALANVSKWAKDDDFWVRRTALLSQERELSRGRGDFDLFAKIAAPMLPEKEFFVRKAIGWVLRSTSKKRPELVHAFLLEHRAAVSGLTLREGAKYLPASARAELGLGAAGPKKQG